MYSLIIKPMLDRVAALLGLLVLSPLFLFVFLLLTFAMEEGAFFVQERPGLNGKIFKLIKFRTMNSRKRADGTLLPDHERLTNLGRIIRKLSLDEIPQLINVLRGDMSFVGPRPLLVEYLPLYNDFQKRRHDVKPGITGWAQVNGRNNLEWAKRFEYDVWYVDNVCFTVDLRILVLTAMNVLRMRDVNQDGHATVENFRGN